MRRPALSSRDGCNRGAQTLYSGHFPIITDDLASPPKGGRSLEEICHGDTAPLMPKATAVWLVDNTALSFDQVADFCKLHPLRGQGDRRRRRRRGPGARGGRGGACG